MKKIFLDSSYIIALEIKNEQNHQAALSYWQTLDRKNTRIITTSHIFDEVVTFFKSRHLHVKAVEIGQRLLNSSSVDCIQVDRKLFGEAWELFQKHDDKLYSLTDCVSFIVMARLNINESLTFDRHFTQAGFIRLP